MSRAFSLSLGTPNVERVQILLHILKVPLSISGPTEDCCDFSHSLKENTEQYLQIG
jgi:hypothetical protein